MYLLPTVSVLLVFTFTTAFAEEQVPKLPSDKVKAQEDGKLRRRNYGSGEETKGYGKPEQYGKHTSNEYGRQKEYGRAEETYGGGYSGEYGDGYMDKKDYKGKETKGDYEGGYEENGKDYNEEKGYKSPKMQTYDNKPKSYGKKERSGYGGYKEEYGGESYNTGKSPFSYGYGKEYSYDTYYCSVHGSFSLALPSETKGYGKGYNKESSYGYGGQEKYSKEASGYGEDDGYGNKKGYGTKTIARFHTRQFCRYAAAYSYKACKFCCKVVARSSNTSPDDIVAAIFAFDPTRPSNNGAGVGYESDDYGGGYGGSNKGYSEYEKKDYNTNSKYQCVCCAPKFKY